MTCTFAGQSSGHRERVAIRDRDDLVTDSRVVRTRPEVLTDSLDEVRAPSTAGVDRSFRVGADDLHPPVGHVLEVATGATNRAASPDAISGCERRQSARLSPQRGAMS